MPVKKKAAKTKIAKRKGARGRRLIDMGTNNLFAFGAWQLGERT
jgi:hypothetical protein